MKNHVLLLLLLLLTNATTTSLFKSVPNAFSAESTADA